MSPAPRSTKTPARRGAGTKEPAAAPANCTEAAQSAARSLAVSLSLSSGEAAGNRGAAAAAATHYGCKGGHASPRQEEAPRNSRGRVSAQTRLGLHGEAATAPGHAGPVQTSKVAAPPDAPKPPEAATEEEESDSAQQRGREGREAGGGGGAGTICTRLSLPLPVRRAPHPPCKHCARRAPSPAIRGRATALARAHRDHAPPAGLRLQAPWGTDPTRLQSSSCCRRPHPSKCRSCCRELGRTAYSSRAQDLLRPARACICYSAARQPREGDRAPRPLPRPLAPAPRRRAPHLPAHSPIGREPPLWSPGGEGRRAGFAGHKVKERKRDEPEERRPRAWVGGVANAGRRSQWEGR